MSCYKEYQFLHSPNIVGFFFVSFVFFCLFVCYFKKNEVTSDPLLFPSRLQLLDNQHAALINYPHY